MTHKISSFLSFLALLAALQLTTAVHYTVTNPAAATPGGVKFANDIGVKHTKRTLTSATSFIWNLFKQNRKTDKKYVARVSVFIDDMDGVAHASNNEIHVSAKYIQGYSGDVKIKITGVLYHELAHAPSHWVQPEEGDRWDQGYDVTARFLDYCNGLRDGLVAELNKKMRGSYNNGFFVELLGKTVDELWAYYKA
ncbi:hypothetical protein L1987_27031 [Smallanthus sonchifolius]|uniref:Uncharacterized protein n=1 Tax=Smallanthus sonchifolius TaxID=185202 RepID=A0ACB9IAK3_9ASTR|nr:hypothetical protein L1987_27031 [Smallanthus sonchifolius]